jgi:flagellar protein FlaG
MQIDGVTNVIDSNRYSEINRNTPNALKVGNKDGNAKPVLQGEERKYTEDELIDKIESANKQFIAYDRRFEFSIHEKTKQIMVKVIDVTTDEIPPEKILDLVASIWEVAGIIVDERV